MSYSLRELREMPTQELIEAHDRVAVHTTVGVNYFLEELRHRDAEAQGDRMEAMTQQMLHLTWVILGLTIINVVAVVVGT